MQQLTAYQRAELWSKIESKAKDVLEYARLQNKSFYIALDELYSLRRTMLKADVADTIKKGETKL